MDDDTAETSSGASDSEIDLTAFESEAGEDDGVVLDAASYAKWSENLQKRLQSTGRISKSNTTYEKLLRSICLQSNISLAASDIFPDDLDRLNDAVSPTKLQTVKKTALPNKFAKFTQIFNDHLKAVKGKSDSNRSSSVNKSSSSKKSMNQSLAKLIRDQRISNWNFKEFKPKEDEAFRAGEFTRYVDEFEDYADTTDCNDMEKLHAMQFKTGEVVSEALQIIRSSSSNRFKTFLEIISALKTHWNRATNPAVVEEKFRKMTRGKDESCLAFLRRLQKNSINVTKLEEFSNYEIARENLIITVVSTGMRDAALQKKATAMLTKYKMTDKSTNRLEKLTTEAMSTDSITPTMPTDEVAMVAEDRHANKRRRIEDPREYREQMQKRGRDVDFDNARSRSRSSGQNSGSNRGDGRRDRPLCRTCFKHHDTNRDCPKCEKCGKIGHFAYQKAVCMQRSPTKLEQKTSYVTETFNKNINADLPKKPSSSGPQGSQTVKCVGESKVSSDDEMLYK